MAENARVLIVDDSSTVRIIISKVITDLGHSVVGTAENGREAVQQLDEAKPDLILLDIEMPVLDGPAALKQIMKKAPGSYVVMLTSADNPVLAEVCANDGAKDFVKKNLPDDELKDRLGQHLTACG